jgi:hypothetical protein
MKNRNLRFNIKQITKNKTFEENKNDLTNSQYNYNDRDNNKSLNYEEENLKLQNEAKHLISKTKRIMEDMGTSNYLSLSRSKSPKSPRLRASIGSPNSSFDEKTFVQSCSHRNASLDLLMSQRLIDKSKRVKELEKELKEKNYLIEKLQAKLEGKTTEVIRLNECLMVIYKLYRKKDIAI